jgi:type VI secretion system secreted protein VgrG
LLAFVAMIGLFFYARSIWGSDLSFSLFASELSKYTQPRPTNTPTLSPFPSATHLQPLSVETITPVPTGTGTSTETLVPTVLVTMVNTDTDIPESTDTSSPHTKVPPANTAYPTATVCSGPPYGWSRYIVRFGDTLNSIAVANGVSTAQLQAANCMGSSITIYAGSALYVPHAATQVIVPTRTFTSAPAPTKTKRPAPSNTPKPPPSDTPVPAPSDTPVPPPTAEPPTSAPPATDTTAPYPSG